jgi:predicted transport protein
MIKNNFSNKKEINELELKLNRNIPENKGQLFMKYKKEKGFLAVLVNKNVKPHYIFFRVDNVYQKEINYKK